MARYVQGLCFIFLPLTSDGFSTNMVLERVRTTGQRHAAVHADLPSHRLSRLVLNDAISNEEFRGQKTRRLKWPRKIWSKILKRPEQSSHDSSLRMQSIAQETGTSLLNSIAKEYKSEEEFILRNFNEVSPDQVLPEITRPLLDSEFYNVSIVSSSGPAVFPTQQGPTRNLSLNRILGSILENILYGITNRRAVEPPENLRIEATPRDGIVPRLLRGQLMTDVNIEIGRLVMRNWRVSACRLEIKRMTLNLKGFMPRNPSKIRFPKQFDLHAHDLTFSRHDLLFSSSIRNGLRTLLVRILRDRGVETSTIKVTSIDILVSQTERR